MNWHFDKASLQIPEVAQSHWDISEAASDADCWRSWRMKSCWTTTVFVSIPWLPQPPISQTKALWGTGELHFSGAGSPLPKILPASSRGAPLVILSAPTLRRKRDGAPEAEAPPHRPGKEVRVSHQAWCKHRKRCHVLPKPRN